MYEVRGECIEWPGSKDSDGYGRYKLNGKTLRIHRVMFFGFHGYWPEVVRHACDNPSCINPSHLLGGTPQDNVNDMMERNRAADRKGENHGVAKLSNDLVYWIRASKLPQKTVADWIGVSQSSISIVRRGKGWKYL